MVVILEPSVVEGYMRLVMLHAKLGLLDDVARRLRSLPVFRRVPRSRSARLTKVVAAYATQRRVPVPHAYIWDALCREQFFLGERQPDGGATAKLLAHRLLYATYDQKARTFYGIDGYQRWINRSLDD